MSVEYGYWTARATAHPARLILNYVGEDFVDKRYEMEGETGAQQWFGHDKQSLDMAFPNLPYYKDETTGTYITQSNAILRYISRKYGLDGDNERIRIQVDMVAEQIRDVIMDFVKALYPSGPLPEGVTLKDQFESKRKDYFEGLHKKLALFEAYLQADKWCVGEKLTYADFCLYNILDMHTYLDRNVIDSYPKLKALVNKFEKLPQIEKYMKSEDYLPIPFVGPMAYLGLKDHFDNL